MQSQLVWDLPLRLWHWIVAGLFALAFSLAQWTSDESQAFTWHMLIGLLLGLLVLLRLLWGLIGTRHARFSALLYSPGQLLGYLKAVARGQPTSYVGHNPANAYAAWAMFALLLTIVASGLLMHRSEAFEELHELAVYLMLGVVALHILGVIHHTVRYRDPITWSMITGRKQVAPTERIESARPLSAVVLLLAVLLGALGLLWSLDMPGRRLVLPLGLEVPLQEPDEQDRGDWADRPAQRRAEHDDD